MSDTVERVAERLARLEKTVADGFHETREEFAAVHAQIDTIGNKFDIVVESIRGDIKTVLEVLTASIDESRRTAAALREEHAADRRLLKLALTDHDRRLRKLERATRLRRANSS